MMYFVLTLSSFMSLQTCGIVIEHSVTLNVFHCRANVKIEFLVIPGNINPFNGGVISSRSTKRIVFNL